MKNRNLYYLDKDLFSEDQKYLTSLSNGASAPKLSHLADCERIKDSYLKLCNRTVGFKGTANNYDTLEAFKENFFRDNPPRTTPLQPEPPETQDPSLWSEECQRKVTRFLESQNQEIKPAKTMPKNKTNLLSQESISDEKILTNINQTQFKATMERREK